MKTKKLITIAFAVLLVAAAAVTGFADRSSSFSHTTTYNELQVYRQGSISGPYVYASISLSFISGVPHQPASDYRCGIRVERTQADGTPGWDYEDWEYGLYCSVAANGSSKPALPNATCKFYINHNVNYSLSSQQHVYKDDISIL